MLISLASVACAKDEIFAFGDAFNWQFLIILTTKSIFVKPKSKMMLKTALYLLGFAASQTLALDLTASPGQVWSQQLFGAAGGNAQAYSGNGLFLTPDGSEVVAIANGGKVASYRASDGEPIWNHNPPDDDGSATFNVETFSGITFSTANSESSFMVYSVTYKDTDSAGNDYT